MLFQLATAILVILAIVLSAAANDQAESQASNDAPVPPAPAIRPDPVFQQAIRQFLSEDLGIVTSALTELSQLGMLDSLKGEVQQRGRRKLAEQFFQFLVNEKYATEGYKIHLIPRAMLTLQGALALTDQDFLSVAAPYLGHEDKAVNAAAEAMLTSLRALTPSKDHVTEDYHFQQITRYLKDLRRNGTQASQFPQQLVMAMYVEDPDAALNTMQKVDSVMARDVQDLPQVHDCAARIHFVQVVGPASPDARQIDPSPRECLKELVASPHWYVRMYVLAMMQKDEDLYNEQITKSLKKDEHPIVRAMATTVEQRDAIDPAGG